MTVRLSLGPDHLLPLLIIQIGPEGREVALWPDLAIHLSQASKTPYFKKVALVVKLL